MLPLQAFLKKMTSSHTSVEKYSQFLCMLSKQFTSEVQKNVCRDLASQLLGALSGGGCMSMVCFVSLIECFQSLDDVKLLSEFSSFDNYFMITSPSLFC